ncbi:hypothetical protein CR513_09624, partial [Mucuna pruriens]
MLRSRLRRSRRSFEPYSVLTHKRRLSISGRTLRPAWRQKDELSLGKASKMFSWRNVKNKKEMEFLKLKQWNMTMANCSAKFEEFQLNVILGMDWLSTNHVLINCSNKNIIFGTPIVGSDEIFIITNQAKAFLQENAQAYVKLSSLKIEKNALVSDVPIVSFQKKSSGFGSALTTLSVFLEDMSSLPPKRETEFSIDLLEEQLEELLRKKFMRPSVSPYKALDLLVKKKDRSIMLRVDYHQLNKVIIKNRYHLPMIDDLIDQLVGACIFSKINLSVDYHQICVKSKDIPKTTFRSCYSHYDQIQSVVSRNLPSQTIPNPKGGNVSTNYNWRRNRNRTHLILNLNQKSTPEFNNRLEPPDYRFPPGHSQ